VVEIWAFAVVAMVLAALGTGWVRRVALARGILDTANARSSHTGTMPRGGGVAVAVVCLVGVLLLHLRGLLDRDLLLATVGGGLPIAWIGFLDDRRSVSVGLRLLVHVASAAWVVYILGGLPPLQVGSQAYDLGIAGHVTAVIAIVWVVNLFNFMDGIDGIAGIEAVMVAGLGAGFAALSGTPGVPAAGLLFAAACGGFLLWNWPPARIFMGDAGSGFLGMYIAVLALAAARSSPIAVFVWLVLAGGFFVDATVTFLRRLLRRVRVHDPHREHAYQRLSRRWRSHLKVDLVLIGINAVWLAPCAWLASAHAGAAALIALVALIPLVIAAIWVGAGDPE
jgi:Fuc2NAc and GlcNAc transferase